MLLANLTSISILHLKGRSQVFLFVSLSSGRSCRNCFCHLWWVTLVYLLHVLADVVWIEFSFTFGVGLNILSSVAIHREQRHPSIQLVLDGRSLLRCSLSLCHLARWGLWTNQLVIGTDIDLYPRIGSTVLSICILKPCLMFHGSNLLLLKRFAQLIGPIDLLLLQNG